MNINIKARKIPPIVYKKTFWQALIGTLSLVFIIFFIKSEQLELAGIGKEITRAKIFPLFVGFLTVLFYLQSQAWLYQWSFRSIGVKLSFRSGLSLFLKRNLISLFIPMGTFSSLAFFNADLKKQHINNIKSYYGSYLFALASMISVVLVFIPGLFLLILQGQVRAIEWFALIGLVLFIFGLIWLVWSLQTEGKVLKFLVQKRPEWIALFKEIKEQEFSRKYFVGACMVSLVIECIGIVQLYIAMAAIGTTTSWEAAFLGYVIMILILSFSPFLKGLAAIEISLTYTLNRYGFNLLEAASITLLFRLFEFWLPLLAGIVSFLKRSSLLIRLLPAVLLFITGLVNIISALTPAISSRLRIILDLFPEGLINLSNYSVMFFGILLIILSGYMFLGTRNAWKTSIVLLIASLVAHLLKAIDYEEAILAGIVLFALVVTRKSYFIKHNISVQKRSYSRIAAVFIGVAIYAILGFYLIHEQHFGIEFNFEQAVEALIKVIMFYDVSTLQPLTSFGKEFLLSIYLLSISAVLYTIYVFLKPSLREITTEEIALEKATELVNKYSKSSLDYFKIYMDKLLFFNQDDTGFLAYRIANHYAVVLEMPVGKDEIAVKQTIKEFENFCTTQGMRSFYYRVPLESLPALDHKKSMIIGQEAVVDLPGFSLGGGEKKRIRNALHKVETAGFHFVVYDPPVASGIIQKMKQVSDEWLDEMQREELVFTQGLFDEEKLKDCVLFTIENDEEKIIAFANGLAAYGRSEITYDLIRKTEDAPNGTLDYLLVNMFEYYKNKGYLNLNMGLAPMGGLDEPQNMTERAMKFVRDNFKQMRRLKGLYDFKDKFDPVWKPSYLLYTDIYDLLQFPRVLAEVSKPINL